MIGVDESGGGSSRKKSGGGRITVSLGAPVMAAGVKLLDGNDG